MLKEEQHILILLQAGAAVLFHHGLTTIPFDSKYINHKTVLRIKDDYQKVSNLLANIQILLYNYEQQYQKHHKFNKALTELYFKFWKLKNIA